MPDGNAAVTATPPLVARVQGFAAPGGQIDLDVRQGDVILLSGANGSGKTSLLRLLAGLPSPLAATSVILHGMPTFEPAAAPARVVAERVHFAQQDPRDGLVGLTVTGEFRLRRQTVPPAQSAWADRETTTLSSGEIRRVALAVAESGRPVLLLLDEPVEGLDAERRARLAALVGRSRQHGAVIVADHSGHLAGLATRRLQLGTVAAPPPVPMPAAGAAVILHSPRETVRREAADVTVPALALSAGLHALCGPNGSGKSTILLRLAGLLGKSHAQVEGAPPAVGQKVRLLLPRARDLFFEDTVAAELHDADRITTDALVPAEIMQRHPLALSGGQAQRVALAKVLGELAPVYLLDEPEAHLDDAGRGALMAILAARINAGACVLCATHDADLLAVAHTVIPLGGVG